MSLQITLIYTLSVDDIKMEYAVIGHALGADGWQKNQKRIKEALIKDAKENGADAILITSMEREVIWHLGDRGIGM